MNFIDTIKNYTPCNEQESKDKEIILKCIDDFKNILTRENELAHITSSGFIISRAKDKVLMIHHNIYNSWAWTGGHADGEKDLLEVAIREAQEETGIKNVVPLTDEIVSIDILTVVGHIKNSKYVAPHLHLSIAYLLLANESDCLKIKPDENSGVKWIPLDEIETYSNEPYMVNVYNKIIKKIK